jgi:hypothetical protein
MEALYSWYSVNLCACACACLFLVCACVRVCVCVPLLYVSMCVYACCVCASLMCVSVCVCVRVYESMRKYVANPLFKEGIKPGCSK